MKKSSQWFSVVLFLAVGPTLYTPVYAASQAAPAKAVAAKSGLLTKDEAAAILPPSVFFAGQSATIQGRNSTGVRLKDGKLVLATIVDTSGYSSGVAERYQAYLIAEVPVHIGNKTLGVGAYGFGFVGNQFLVMNIAGETLITVPSAKDEAIPRPTPLQMLSTPHAGVFRLYAGRTYVEVSIGQ